MYPLQFCADHKVAIDCGCGAGANISYLRNKGFTVHAFDIDQEAVTLCEERFNEDDNVFICKAGFTTFDYPRASLILADASLFFCPTQEFKPFIEKVSDSLQPGGVFYGSFLGQTDTMAKPEYRDQVYWGEPLVKTQSEIREAFSDFEILKLSEIIEQGVTPAGRQHHWHIHVLVVRKLDD